MSAYNVNIACGSGMKATQLGAQQIMLGDAEVVLVGGMENMTRVPFLLDRMRGGYRMGDATVVDAMYRDGLLDPLCGLIMGETAENLVDTLRHLARGAGRVRAGVPAEGGRRRASGGRPRCSPSRSPAAEGTVTVERGRAPAPGHAPWSRSAQLAPVFREGGSVTAGNSSGITDGAAAMVLMSESRAHGRGPRAPRAHRRHELGRRGPRVMGIGPVPATKKVLERTGLSLADIDVIEMNEAFAAQVIACDRELKFDRDRLNMKGGGISLGHPIGMSGARIILTLAYELRDRGLGARPRHALHLRRPGPGRRHRARLRRGSPMSVHAVVLIQCEIDAIPEAAQAIADIAGVSEVYSVAGEFDLVAIVRVAAHDDLAPVIPGGIGKVEGVERTETLIAFQVYSSTTWSACSRSASRRGRAQPAVGRPVDGDRQRRPPPLRQVGAVTRRYLSSSSRRARASSSVPAGHHPRARRALHVADLE